MEKVNYKPAKQRVLVLPRETGEKKTQGGIIIPDQAKDDAPGIGVIVRVGDGESDIPMEYAVGQTVIYSQYSGLDTKLNLVYDGEHTYKIMNQMDIMGVIKSEE